jgi:hypothetical protein
MTEAQDDRANELMTDEPKIDAAVKNHLAKVFAESLTAPEQGAKSLPSGSSSSDTNEAVPPIDPAIYRKLAGVLLREINAFSLLPPTEWGGAHPQGKEQTGMARMEQLGDYKVYHLLLQRVKTNNGKPTKFFGRLFLQFVFTEICASLITGPEAATKCRGVSAEVVKRYLDEIGSSFDVNAGLGELVWATDFNAALRDRHAKRKTEAAERLATEAKDLAKRANEGCTLTKQVIEAVTGQEGVGTVDSSGGSSGQQSWIEDVTTDVTEKTEKEYPPSAGVVVTAEGTAHERVTEQNPAQLPMKALEAPHPPIPFPSFHLLPRREYDMKTMLVGGKKLQSVGPFA